MINEAIGYITEQAMEIAEKEPEKRNAIIKIEEHLTAKCTTTAIAEMLLKKEKSLKELYKKIEDHARKKLEESKTHSRVICLTSQQVFEIADEYYEIASDTTSTEKLSMKGVDLFDLL